MLDTHYLRVRGILTGAGILALFTAAVVLLPLRKARTGASDSFGPWTDLQIVRPSALAKELADSKIANRPIVVCVGFGTLYQNSHIRGAVFHGAASSEAGLKDLKKWAEDIPRNKTVVIYCGCCPFSRCPNARPAFEALQAMAFTHLKILSIPTDFLTDWVDKGYPIETGK